MLTREHAICEYRNGGALPDRLQTFRHERYEALAEAMLRIYAQGVGRRRCELHHDVEQLFDDVEDCPPRRIAAFCKLLDDAGKFDTDRRSTKRKLRMKVYDLAAERHPLVRDALNGILGCSEADVKTGIAKELGQPWSEIEDDFFADVIEFQKLRRFDGYESPRALLSRYNVAQTQAALYDAVEVRVEARRDWKAILRQARLAGLLHTVERCEVGGETTYLFVFDGPASVLRQTTRYGAALARFLPSLLACREWTLEARLKPKAFSPVVLRISDKSGLTSPVEADTQYDSSVEENFAKEWGTGERDGWTLLREDAILTRGQKVFIPDFVLRNGDGTEIFFEIAGFWSEKYWERKRETLAAFADRRIVLAIPKNIEAKDIEASFPVVRYGTKLRVKQVLECLRGLESYAL
jgi:uncharacterized protein